MRSPLSLQAYLTESVYACLIEENVYACHEASPQMFFFFFFKTHMNSVFRLFDRIVFQAKCKC